ncbi:MAG: GNAT family N-acetyltransferase [Deltaproteobacteria bacterium]|nr:GNAT family N-acetyltransferase [Candidatus Zymogenaceae bacterium]
MSHIVYLADVPQYLPIVAYWNYREWHIGKRSFDEIIRRYQARMNYTDIPITLVAVEDTMPVGSVSIKMDDLMDRTDLNPWLASLYVVADYRGRGIGNKLLQAVQDTAGAVGIARLYLYTHTANALYERDGWSNVDTFERESGIIETVYCKDM